MKSMTGYALSEKQLEEGFVSLEIKSYNSRYLDIVINLPFWLSGLEPVFKALISEKISRGKIEVSLRVKNLSVGVDISANTEVATSYVKAMQEIANACHMPMNLDMTRFVEKDGVLAIDKNIDLNDWQKRLKPIFKQTIKKFDKSRMTEGEALKKDILYNLEKITSALQIIKEYAPKMEETFCNNIKTRAKDLLDTEIDEKRIMQEVAIMLVKYTINEEIVRLEAHCKSLYNELESESAVGKKLDFICQEINREINTIGSKNQMIEMSESIISVKDSLENIREQARNIE